MIPLLSRSAVRAIDAHAVEQLGIPGLVLMENAGRGACDAIVERFGDCLGRVVLVGGPGQNGGDAWVVARHLRGRGHLPRAVLLGAPSALRGDAKLNYDALSRIDVAPIAIEGDDLSPLAAELARASLVVDGLFGTGLDRPVAGRFADAIELINGSAAPVVALDLPSGVDADRGAELGTAVRAALTVTFAAHKLGLHQYPAAALCGELRCVSIGVPGPTDAPAMLIEASDVGRWVPPRAPDAHKGTAGHVLVIAGGAGRTGAAILSGLGALRAGAGLTTLAGRGQARAAFDAKVVELMSAALPEDNPAAIDAALELGATLDAAVVGPGLGLDPGSRELSIELALRLAVPAVLDADALTALGTDYGRLKTAAGARVLTPHPGEAARLLGVSTSEVQADRYAAARELSETSGAVALLKGARTVIARPGGSVRVCATGTPAMAVAGSGDVLAGVVAALLCTLEPFDAASAGAHLHGLAGELAARGDRGLFASELAARVPEALLRCWADTKSELARAGATN